MSGIDDDYVKIVMHAQVQVLQQAQPDEQASLAGAQYQASDDPVQGTSGMQRALAAGPAPGEEVVFAPEEAPVGRAAVAAAAAARGGAAGGARTPPSSGPAATTRVRAGAARSSSSATGAERCRPPCGTSTLTSALRRGWGRPATI